MIVPAESKARGALSRKVFYGREKYVNSEEPVGAGNRGNAEWLFGKTRQHFNFRSWCWYNFVKLASVPNYQSRRCSGWYVWLTDILFIPLTLCPVNSTDNSVVTLMQVILCYSRFQVCFDSFDYKLFLRLASNSDASQVSLQALPRELPGIFPGPS